MVLAAAASTAGAVTRTYTLTTSPGEVEVTHTGSYHSVRILTPGYSQMEVVGEPALAFRVVSILLAPNEQVAGFEITPHGAMTIQSDVMLEPIQAVSKDGMEAVGSGLAERSETGDVFPASRGRYLATGYLHGRAIASFAVYPLRVVGPDLVLTEHPRTPSGGFRSQRQSGALSPGAKPRDDGRVWFGVAPHRG
jgi:hypothetical protein